MKTILPGAFPPAAARFSTCVLKIYSDGESQQTRCGACSAHSLKPINDLPVPVGWMTAAFPVSASMDTAESYAFWLWANNSTLIFLSVPPFLPLSQNQHFVPTAMGQGLQPACQAANKKVHTAEGVEKSETPKEPYKILLSGSFSAYEIFKRWTCNSAVFVITCQSFYVVYRLTFAFFAQIAAKC